MPMSVDAPAPESKREGLYFNVCMHLSFGVRKGRLTCRERAVLVGHYDLSEALLLRCERALLAYGPKVGEPQCRQARQEAVRRLMELGKDPWGPEFWDERAKALERIQAATPETEVTREAKAADNALRIALGLPPAFDLPPKEEAAPRGEVRLPLGYPKEYWDFFYLEVELENISRKIFTDEERAALCSALAERYSVSEAWLVWCERAFRAQHLAFTERYRKAWLAAMQYMNALGKDLLTDELGKETSRRYRRRWAAAPDDEVLREYKAARTALRAAFGLLPVEEGEPVSLVFGSASMHGEAWVGPTLHRLGSRN